MSAEQKPHLVQDIAQRWNTYHDRGAHDYTDEGCRVLAEHAFRDVAYLIEQLESVQHQEDLAKEVIEGLKEQLEAKQRLLDSAASLLKVTEARAETLEEQLQTAEKSARKFAAEAFSWQDKATGLEEQLEAAQTAMRRTRHELDQWVFADGSASYRVERAEAILDAVLNPAKERDV